MQLAVGLLDSIFRTCHMPQGAPPVRFVDKLLCECLSLSGLWVCGMIIL